MQHPSNNNETSTQVISSSLLVGVIFVHDRKKFSLCRCCKNVSIIRSRRQN